jgi:hypothetical protein
MALENAGGSGGGGSGGPSGGPGIVEAANGGGAAPSDGSSSLGSGGGSSRITDGMLANMLALLVQVVTLMILSGIGLIVFCVVPSGRSLVGRARAIGCRSCRIAGDRPTQR